MTILRVPLLALLLVASLPAVALAQAAPVPPTERVVGRVLTLDEAIAIALEAQPSIQATLYDYAGARARVREAFAPLLPQLSGSVSATRSSSSAVQTSTVTRQTVIVSINRQPAFLLKSSCHSCSSISARRWRPHRWLESSRKYRPKAWSSSAS